MTHSAMDEHNIQIISINIGKKASDFLFLVQPCNRMYAILPLQILESYQRASI